ncbi:hypothetical protein GJA_2223 [Janthinobacterium agaricidamnosum NBRC 102515 = DSM 9628]|uniref:Uncharacterized protein n=1 Tax=Janthinobacterium agaricidamnosum NBRC 102515 = DSM 9628 TaxID=1349767 RepID=W0V682_9BURK|nr:hypothetical protein GJA_2223 [Janthinobacterium agaricidamnosum NBRC 102515 = DSM 9628]
MRSDPRRPRGDIDPLAKMLAMAEQNRGPQGRIVFKLEVRAG